MSGKTFNFDKLCRTCMSCEGLKSIFLYENGTIELANMIMSCASVQISQNDGLPSNICSNCIVQVNQAYAFRKRCEQVNSFFHLNIFNNKTDIKEEDYYSIVGEEVKSEICNNIKIEENISNINHKNVPSNANDIVNDCWQDNNSWDEDIAFKKSSKNNYCKLCKISFNTRKEYRQHRKNHSRNKLITCQTCEKKISSKHAYLHMRTHTKEKPYTCKVCNKGFSFNQNLKRHMKIHTGERPYICNICGKGFIQAVTLSAHLRVHTGERPFKCSYCGKAFKQTKHCSLHMQTHLNNSTQKRKQGRPAGLAYKKRTMPAELPYPCEICDKRCSSKSLLKMHQLQHGEKTFLCSDCGKAFVTKAGLNQHSVVHSGKKPFSCNICEKSFAYSSYLKVHMLRHTGEKPHHCHVCQKSFAQSTHLKTHLRLHDGSKPHSCSVCGKDFALKGNLTVHMRIHTGETPYLCPLCNKGFYDSSSMRKHHRAHIKKT